MNPNKQALQQEANKHSETAYQRAPNQSIKDSEYIQAVSYNSFIAGAQFALAEKEQGEGTNWDADSRPLYQALQQIVFLFSEYHEAKSIANKAMGKFKYPHLKGTIIAHSATTEAVEKQEKWLDMPIDVGLYYYKLEGSKVIRTQGVFDYNNTLCIDNYGEPMPAENTKRKWLRIPTPEQLLSIPSIQPGKSKPFIAANVRDITDQYFNGQHISFSKMVELFNDIAEKFYNQSVDKEDRTEMLERCRIYAESKMIDNWDRKDYIMVGIFYKHYVDAILTTSPTINEGGVHLSEADKTNLWCILNLCDDKGMPYDGFRFRECVLELRKLFPTPPTK